LEYSVETVFISYNSADRLWSEWIGWQLENAGYQAILQAWDFSAGSNFVLKMQEATREATRTIAVLSEAYLKSLFTQPEWAAAFLKDPTGEKRILVPVRVEKCEPDGMWSAIVYIDLVGVDEERARQLLIAGFSGARAKPELEPPFPGSQRRSDQGVAPAFPGKIASSGTEHQTINPQSTSARDAPMPDAAPQNALLDSSFAGNNLASIIGRQTDVENVTNELKNRPLVTILGPGGCGKSRLAMEVAKVAAVNFPDGVSFIPLSELSLTGAEKNPLPVHVGKLIGVSERPNHPPNEALIQHFRTGAHLLVLDNCEHLIASCRAFAISLVTHCPGLRILATSRVALEPTSSDSSECLYDLQPLDVPSEARVTPEQVGGSSSVQLLIERASRRTKFEITAENAAATAAVCRSLCGLPLAIELTAARLRGTTIQSLWKEIRQGTFDVDKGAKGNTMRATIDRSYKPLQPDAQAFLRQLSVFRGGWTQDAAAAVCNQEAGLTENFINELVDSSLLTRTENGEMRFGFLEPIRQFVQQELTPSETAAVQRRHADYFLRVAEREESRLTTKEQDEALETLEPELDNYRVAVRWTIDQQQPEAGLRLMASLWRFIEIHTYYTDGLDWAEKVLGISGTAAFPSLRCKLLAGRGMLAYRMAKYTVAQSLFQECLDLATSVKDKVWIAEALGDLGLVAMMKGEFQLARERFTECKALEEVNQNTLAVANANFNLGFLALGIGEYEEAEKDLKIALLQFDAKGNDRGKAFALNSLARCCIVAGDLKTAVQHSNKALAIRRHSKDSKCVADSLRTSAWAALEAERYPEALEQLQEAVGKAQGVDDLRGISEALDLFALMGARRGISPTVVELAAAAENIRGSYGYAIPPVLKAERANALVKAKEHLGELEYSRAWDRGSMLSQADAIDAALESATPSAAASKNVG
jgi:predicted ATPase